MKRFLKGVKCFVKNSTEKVITAVNDVLFTQQKLMIAGIIIAGVGIGLGGSMVIAAKTAF